MSDDLKNLLRADYEGIAFPVAESPTNGSNTIVQRAALDQSGYDLQPTGFNGHRGSLRIPLFNSLEGWPRDLFPTVFLRLCNKFENTPVGRLTHPTHGIMQAGILEWDWSPDPQRRNGIDLTVKWVQQRAQSTSGALNFRSNDARTEPDAVARRAAVCDSIAAGDTGQPAAPSSYTATYNEIASQLAFLDTAQRTRGEVQSALNAMLAVCTGNIDAIASAPFPHLYVELFAALYSLRAMVLASRSRYLDTRDRSGVFVTPRDMSAWEIAASPDVYGDAMLAHRIMSANNLLNPCLIPVGTRIEVPPVN